MYTLYKIYENWHETGKKDNNFLIVSIIWTIVEDLVIVGML